MDEITQRDIKTRMLSIPEMKTISGLPVTPDATYYKNRWIARGQINMDRIRSNPLAKARFLESARIRHPFFVAWDFGMMEYQARQLIKELEV